VSHVRTKLQEFIEANEVLAGRGQLLDAWASAGRTTEAEKKWDNANANGRRMAATIEVEGKTVSNEANQDIQ
jgi:hypothetical protein